MVYTLNGNQIEYHELGEGTPILMLHGFPVDHHIMSGCMEPVFETLSGYRRIYMDMPGLGASKAAATLQTAEEMLQLIEAFVRDVIGTEPFLVAGESYGGLMTLGLLTTPLASQIAGALLLCPRVHYRTDKAQMPKKTLLVADEALIASTQSDAFKGFLEYAVLATPQTWARYLQDVQCGLEAADPSFVKGFNNDAFPSWRWQAMETLTYDKPTCFIMGRQDHAVGYTDGLPYLQQFSRVTYAVLDGAGHNAQFERQPLFEALLQDWLIRAAQSTEPASQTGSHQQ